MNHPCDGQTDRQTDGRNSWARTHGAQLTAGYTVNTYSKSHLYYYTLGAVAPLLPYALGPSGPLPHRHATPIYRSLGGRTDRQTRLTNQPTGQQPFCQYPAVSCKLGIAIAYARLAYMLSRAKSKI